MKPGMVYLNGNELVIACLPHVAIKLRRVFGGVHRKKAGLFSMAATAANAYELEWFRSRYPLDLDDGCAKKFRSLVATEKRKLATLAEVAEVGYVPREFDLALPPRKYQREAADLAIRTRQILIADDLGVGKTVSAICALTAPDALPALVVTMTHLPRQWAGELGRFAPALTVHQIKKGTPYDFTTMKPIGVVNGKRRRRQLPAQPDVLIISYSKLDGWVEALAGKVRTVVFDEVQELRIADSDKYKAAYAIAEQCDMRIGLSATPVYNYGAEIFSVLNVIAPGELGTKKEFLDEWCGGSTEGTVADSRKVCVSDPAALGTHLRESGLMLRRTRRDVGRELPALTVIRHVVEVDATRINEVVADVAEIAQRVLDRTGTNFELMKMSGEIDMRMRQATGIGKAPAVADFVRLLVESGERVVLFGWHHEVYAIWRAIFDREHSQVTYAMYTGQQSDTEKAESFRRFTSGECKVLIMSLRAGAGLDGLQKVCRTVVIGELDWSPQVIHQDIGRVHRDGQAEPVMAYYLVAEEGSDPAVADVLGIKEAQATGIRDPDAVGSPQLVGSAGDHVRRLAEDLLRRRAAARQEKAS